MRRRATRRAALSGALPPPTARERLAIIATAFVITVGAIAALSGFFAGQDQAGVMATATGPGQLLPDRGDAVLAPGAHRPPYASDPPTSGAHRPEAIARDATRLTVDQELEALALGNVVIAYGTPRPPHALREDALRLGAPFSSALALSGQAMVLDHRPGTRGLLALAWRHLLRVASPKDPALVSFVSFWLGRGAPDRAHR